ncbi:hypothetical protein M5689_001552 [Euphorbia peplus]|nr:hypothetical protein M5689_001552 [Euphorbia peplus]
MTYTYIWRHPNLHCSDSPQSVIRHAEWSSGTAKVTTYRLWFPSSSMRHECEELVEQTTVHQLNHLNRGNAEDEDRLTNFNRLRKQELKFIKTLLS